MDWTFSARGSRTSLARCHTPATSLTDQALGRGQGRRLGAVGTHGAAVAGPTSRPRSEVGRSDCSPTALAGSATVAAPRHTPPTSLSDEGLRIIGLVVVGTHDTAIPGRPAAIGEDVYPRKRRRARWRRDRHRAPPPRR